MKRRTFLCAALFCAAILSHAQEAGRFALGPGLEGNMNTRSGAAGGASLSAFYGFNQRVSLGLKGSFSHNFDRIMIFEPEVLFRWYAFPWGKSSFFFQTDLGSSLIFEDGKLFPAFLGGLTAGIRIPAGPLFFEPFVRGGYPFIWGAGAALIYPFGQSSPADAGGDTLRR
jgi:hypothetical protein